MNDSGAVTIAAAQYEVQFLGSWEVYDQKLDQLVRTAADQDAQILLFPEYGCMELASLFSPEVYRSLHGQLDAMQELLSPFLRLHTSLAQRHGVYIIAASFPVKLPDGSYHNRAYFCAPDGQVDFQDKLIMTRFENELWGIRAGNEAKVFPTPYGPLGITICYDAEFPLIARRMVEQGARLILAPSCTDTVAGYNRVRIGCQARALENQCYVVMSPLVGSIDWSEAIDVNIGAAGVFTPVDYGFPGNGVLVMGEMNKPQWLIAELDLEKISYIRQHGQVINHRDWDHQYRITQPAPPTDNWLTPPVLTAFAHEKVQMFNRITVG